MPTGGGSTTTCRSTGGRDPGAAIDYDWAVHLPIVEGVIRRRLLLNYRVDPEWLARRLPRPFRPSLHAGWGVAGICLIRLEQLRPRLMPAQVGASSENAAHRVAVVWDGPDGEPREGVYVERRDTDSLLARLAGGRIFPGEHKRASFDVFDDGREVRLAMHSHDGRVAIRVEGRASAALPATSIFGSLREASGYFERGSLGYSPSASGKVFDGLVLRTDEWAVHPFDPSELRSSVFDDRSLYPPERIAFDHALVMRDVQHAWVAAPDLCDQRAAG